ncbi:MAG: hypothetical protein HYX76_15355 [Acidobacteria bacterium]|nr:hypothetical protein [Acidobacteriota bacterium]
MTSPGGLVRRVSRAERSVSLVLLALLAVIAALIYAKGQHFDRRVFVPNPRLFVAGPSTARVANTLRERDDPELEAGTTATPLVASARTPSLEFPSAIEGTLWRADGPVEEFDASTLYRKIDGRADEYLRYGFNRLQFVSYVNADRFIDVFAYDMGSPERAAAVFRAERPPDVSAADIGQQAYHVAGSYFFTAARHYVQIVASEPSSDAEAAALRIARSVEAVVAR